MGHRLNALVNRIREEKGPFFLARLSLRVKVPLARADLADDDEYEEEVVRVCRSLGYDPLASKLF